MQRTGNIQRLLAQPADAERVLDVGGAHRPLNTATHTLNALPYSDRGQVLFRDVPERFSAASWLQLGMCERLLTVSRRAFRFLVLPRYARRGARSDRTRSDGSGKRDPPILAGPLRGARVAGDQAWRDRGGACPVQEGEAAQAPQRGRAKRTGNGSNRRGHRACAAPAPEQGRE
jgi:hypothetical protein